MKGENRANRTNMAKGTKGDERGKGDEGSGCGLDAVLMQSGK